MEFFDYLYNNIFIPSDEEEIPKNESILIRTTPKMSIYVKQDLVKNNTEIIDQLSDTRNPLTIISSSIDNFFEKSGELVINNIYIKYTTFDNLLHGRSFNKIFINSIDDIIYGIGLSHKIFTKLILDHKKKFNTNLFFNQERFVLDIQTEIRLRRLEFLATNLNK